MTGTRATRRTTRYARRLPRPGAAVVRLAFAATLLLHLLGGIVVPTMHAGAHRPLAAHLDQPGSVHHAHDEGSCATCVAGHGPGRIERPAAVLPLVLVAVVAAAAYDNRVVAARVDPTSSPRAPPPTA